MLTQTSKNVRTAGVWVVAAIFLVIFAGKDAPILVGVAIVAVPVAVILVIRAAWSAMTQSKGETEMLRVAESLPYKNFSGNTGIALDATKGELHLYEKPNYVVYPFDKIRGWSAKVQTGGVAYGSGLVTAVSSIESAAANKKASGLFIEVKDIDHPSWRVEFSGRSREKEMTRWVEILRQHVNQDR